MGSSDTLELPEVVLVELHRFGVSASQALGKIGVVESLSVAELLISEGKTESHAHEEAASHTNVVRVEVLRGSTGYIVTIRCNGTEGSEDHGRGATKNGVHVAGIPEGHVEVLRVELDELDQLNLALHLLVGFFHVVFVAHNMGSVTTSHFAILFLFLVIIIIK